MSKFEERMENIFNVAPTQNEEIVDGELVINNTKESPLQKIDLDSDLKVDYDDTRETYQELIEKGKNAIDDMLSIARETENPRAFEVVATLLNTVSETNTKLMDLQKKIREISGNSSKQATTKIDKAIFVGSTAELAKMIKDMKSGDE